MHVERDTGQATEARQILLSRARGRSHRVWMEATLTTHVPFEDRLSCTTTPPGCSRVSHSGRPAGEHCPGSMTTGRKPYQDTPPARASRGTSSGPSALRPESAAQPPTNFGPSRLARCEHLSCSNICGDRKPRVWLEQNFWPRSGPGGMGAVPKHPLPQVWESLAQEALSPGHHPQEHRGGSRSPWSVWEPCWDIGVPCKTRSEVPLSSVKPDPSFFPIRRLLFISLVL